MKDPGLSSFFYNIIPGSLFLIGLQIVGFGFILENAEGGVFSEGINIIILIVYASFLGFCFQGCTKIFREIGLNNLCFFIVKNNNEEQYKQAESYLKTKKMIKKSNNPADAFYMFDNYLRGNSKADQSIHFSSRFAFWSNIFIGSTIFMLTLVFTGKFYSVSYLLGIVLVLFIFSLIQAALYFYAYYDVVLKTFVAVVLDGKDESKPTKK